MSTVNHNDNPIFQTFCAIWNCLVANTTFATLVPEENRIDYTGTKRNPEKSGLNSADCPQVRVVQTGLEGQIFRSSSSCSMSVYWSIEAKMGDKQMESLTDLQWAIYCAMSHWKTYIRDSVKWEEQSVFRKLAPMKVVTDEERRLNQPNGWQTVYSCRGELWATTAEVQACPDADTSV